MSSFTNQPITRASRVAPHNDLSDAAATGQRMGGDTACCVSGFSTALRGSFVRCAGGTRVGGTVRILVARALGGAAGSGVARPGEHCGSAPLSVMDGLGCPGDKLSLRGYLCEHALRFYLFLRSKLFFDGIEDDKQADCCIMIP
jgi:hypothetical protein